MQTLTLAQAKRDHAIGYLTTFRIEKIHVFESETETGWILYLGEGNSEAALCEARNKTPRVFKSLDRVVTTLESIGFTVLTLR